MAKCEKRQIVPEPPPVEYVLTLSAEEARVVARSLFDFVSLGAEPEALAVVTALSNSGVCYLTGREVKGLGNRRA